MCLKFIFDCENFTREDKQTEAELSLKPFSVKSHDYVCFDVIFPATCELNVIKRVHKLLYVFFDSTNIWLLIYKQITKLEFYENVVCFIFILQIQ